MCWLDADCIPVTTVSSPFDMASRRKLQLDAAVTLRPAPEIGLSNNPALDYLNSGVVWIRNTMKGREFCRLWGADVRAFGTDQGALNRCVDVAPDAFEWNCDRVAMSRIGICTARVLILDAMEWNCWHFPPPPEARILHFKGGIRYLAKDYVNR